MQVLVDRSWISSSDSERMCVVRRRYAVNLPEVVNRKYKRDGRMGALLHTILVWGAGG